MAAAARDAMERAYRARWLVDGRGNAWEGGSIRIRAGRIVELDPRGASADATDVGDVALVPGFVNAHTHLDLSDVAQPTRHAGSFTDWLERVIRHRGTRPGSEGNAIRSAIRAMIANGTTLVGDISTDGASSSLLDAEGLPAVVWHEVLGLNPSRYETLWQGAVQAINTKGSAESTMTLGISPHAPYSTALEIYRRAGGLGPGVPLATHWLESVEEVELLTTGRGEMAQFLARIGAWNGEWTPTADPWQAYFGAGGENGARWVLAHGNYITGKDIERLTRPDLVRHVGGVVYCPRTHAYFGHPPHPFVALRRAGIPVALGTDSLASNPDLAVHEEARFLATRHAAVDPAWLLAMLTLEGARVLGRADQTGSLEVGKRADLAVVDLGNWRGAVHEGIFAPEARIVGTLIGGRWLAGGPGVPNG